MRKAKPKNDNRMKTRVLTRELKIVEGGRLDAPAEVPIPGDPGSSLPW